jgi:hypothetical protein
MRQIISIIAILFTLSSQAQFMHDDTHFSFKYSYGTIGPARYNCYSLNAELFLTNGISANYNFDLTYRSDNVRHLHVPLGLIGGPPLIILGLLSSNSANSGPFGLGKGGALLGLVLLILPDGIGFHIPIRDKLDISPYANFLGLDFIRNRTTGDHDIKYAASFGSKLTFLTKNQVTLSVFAEARKPARIPWFYGIGFGVGYYF